MLRHFSTFFRSEANLVRGITTIAVQDRETPSEIADVIHVHLNSGSQSMDLSDMSRYDFFCHLVQASQLLKHHQILVTFKSNNLATIIWVR
jgi:hypothetical protein